MKFNTAALYSSSMFIIAATNSIQQAKADGTVYKGTILVDNMAPENGTCQTPTWFGIHKGSFDTYNRGEATSAELERLAEDGTVGPISEAFLATDGAVLDGTVGGAPLCPGMKAAFPFEITAKPGTPLYFSYASMVLPSNDAFLSNGDPMAHMIVDNDGNFVEVVIQDTGADVLDAGTEVNDESNTTTAFFGQSAPNTGTAENGVVTEHPGFLASGSGGILDDPQFANADFTADGYNMLKIKIVLDKVYKGKIKVTNEAPENGTCQTPVWVGIHDGSFDSYDRDAPASAGLERIAEDGTPGPISDEFNAVSGSVWDGVVGDAPLCFEASAELAFEVRVAPGRPLYFSYATMVLPSNDAFLANGNPMAFPIFDESGAFVPVSFVDIGSDVLDAGTEDNDEIPANTAFFGQMAPDTGSIEAGVVTEHPGFKPAGNGGILDSENFANADFTVDGYEMLKVEVVLMMDEDMESFEPSEAPTTEDSGAIAVLSWKYAMSSMVGFVAVWISM